MESDDLRGYQFEPERHGIQLLDWDELSAKHGFNKRRSSLIEDLNRYLSYISSEGLKLQFVFLGGSFCSNKEFPSDIDCMLLHRGNFQTVGLRQYGLKNANIDASFLQTDQHPVAKYAGLIDWVIVHQNSKTNPLERNQIVMLKRVKS